MGAEVQGHPTGAQPHEGSRKEPRSSLYVRPGTTNPFTAGVLHFPLPAKFIMPQIETFDGTKDPIDHLNTYKNQMELHGYQNPIRCRAFAITLKGPALA